MSKSSILSQLKEVIYSMYDINGNLRVKYVGMLSEHKLSEGRNELLKNITSLVLNTNIISEETKLYIKDRNIKYKQVTELINEKRAMNNELIKISNDNGGIYSIGEPISHNSVISKIQYDKLRLEKFLDYDIITNIVFRPNYNIEHYQLVVGKLLAKYNGVESLRDKLIFNINEENYSKHYIGDFIEEFKDILFIYTKDYVKMVEEKLNKNKDFVGYFNFLLSGVDCPDEKTANDRRLLRDILSNNISCVNISDNCMSVVKTQINIDKKELVNEDTNEVNEDTNDNLDLSELDIVNDNFKDTNTNMLIDLDIEENEFDSINNIIDKELNEDTKDNEIDNKKEDNNTDKEFNIDNVDLSKIGNVVLKTNRMQF